MVDKEPGFHEVRIVSLKEIFVEVLKEVYRIREERLLGVSEKDEFGAGFQ